MNLNEATNAIEQEIDRAVRRLNALIDNLTGPLPEKPVGPPPKEPGLVGSVKYIGQGTLEIHRIIDQLEGFLINPKALAGCNQQTAQVMPSQFVGGLRN